MNAPSLAMPQAFVGQRADLSLFDTRPVLAFGATDGAAAPAPMVSPPAEDNTMLYAGAGLAVAVAVAAFIYFRGR